jgi:carbon-monoxide dehydrogenase small subunit
MQPACLGFSAIIALDLNHIIGAEDTLSTIIKFFLNERNVTAEVRNNETLLQLLREDLHVTSLKNCCNIGECGACTVIINGKAIRSCIQLAVMVDGKRVETVESLGTPAKLHPLQKAFLECGAMQCGYCTCGMLMTAKAFLDENRSPKREDIRVAMSGNLCRCAAYKKILDAIELAAEWMRGGAS